MTSISDVFDQLVNANNTLGQLHGDMQAEITATKDVNTSVKAVKTSVDKLDDDVNNGFATTINALGTLAQIEAETAKLVFHLTQQADAMICALEHISKNTCGILTEATVQTKLQTQIAEDTNAVRFIADTTHANAALERERLEALRAQTERCCPPEVRPPACSYEPCPHPEPVDKPQLPDPPHTSDKPG